MRCSRGADDPDATAANQFYLDNREAMDAGAVVSNPYRFDSTLLADGSPREVSALQHCFNIVADRGRNAFNTEYQNDPPESTGPVESGINVQLIQKQLSGYPRGVIPPGCTILTQGVDIGKWDVHWVVRAWKPDGTAFTIDYGIQKTAGAKFAIDEGTDQAIYDAILRRAEEFTAAAYCNEQGELIRDPLTLVDASYRTDAVYGACTTIGMGWLPVMGFGKSVRGAAQANFSQAQRAGPDCTPGDGWKMVRRGPIWLVEADTDRWKAFEHDRWMTPVDQAGCFFLFGESDHGAQFSVDERSHGQYAHQVCAEVEVEDMQRGVLRRRWKTTSKDNHFLDASYYSSVAAQIKGIASMAGKAIQQLAETQTKPKSAIISRGRERGPGRW